MSSRVRVEPLGGDRELAPPECGQARHAAQQIALHQDVIGDRNDVEPSGPAVQIHDLANRQATVAPARVYVEVAEEKRLVSGLTFGAVKG